MANNDDDDDDVICLMNSNVIFAVDSIHCDACRYPQCCSIENVLIVLKVN